MNLILLLIIILIILGVAGLPHWPYWGPSPSYGYYPSGLVGLLVLVLIIALLFGYRF